MQTTKYANHVANVNILNLLRSLSMLSSPPVFRRIMDNSFVLILIHYMDELAYSFFILQNCWGTGLANPFQRKSMK